jgi:signal peptidase I
LETFKKSETREIIEAFAGSVITILFIMIFIVQSFLVKGSSMEHTMHDGERLLVDKITFRLRPPKTGDIIVFKYPGDPRKKYIKRVIATEGQTIEIRNKTVRVEGMVLDEPYIAELTESGFDFAVVPDDTIFAMGDNRNRSSDSRSPDVGFVPMENIVGRAFFVYWSPIHIKLPTSLKWPPSKEQPPSIEWPKDFIRVLKMPKYERRYDYNYEPSSIPSFEENQ